MIQTLPLHTATYAVCDTGPLISAFQSDSYGLLQQIFAAIHISPICAGELMGHGWETAVQANKVRASLASRSIIAE